MKAVSFTVGTIVTNYATSDHQCGKRMVLKCVINADAVSSSPAHAGFLPSSPMQQLGSGHGFSISATGLNSP